MASTTTKDLQLPILHLNGSGRDNLRDQFKTLYRAARDLENLMCQNGPHARDYFPLGDGAFLAAREQHVQRLQAIQQLVEDYKMLYYHVELS